MTVAIVPVKHLARGKSRLAATLGREGAEKLALAMLEDVVAALRAVRGIEFVAVVTPDAAVAEAAEKAGARALLGADPGLNEAIDRAARELDAEATVVVLGDVAGADSADLAALLETLDALPVPAAVLAPARDGGSAALARRPHGAIASRFGPDSANAHRRAARESGVAWAGRALASLSLDLDDERDLHAFLATSSGGAHTRAMLRELGVETNG